MPVPVVLVHGLGSSFAHNWGVSGWDDILQSEGFEAVGYELPGHGAAPEAVGGESEAVQRLLDLVSTREPVDAIGFSAGARLVLCIIEDWWGRLFISIVAGRCLI